MKFATKAIHAGVQPDPTTGAIMTPIYQTSTYVQESPGKHKGYAYARGQNPTRDALQASIAALENGKFAYCFSSGVAATDTVLKTLRPGDEVIASDDLYGGTYRIFMRVFAHFGISFKYVKMQDAQALRAHITDQTKLIWIETPSNPLMNIIDIEEVSKIAKERGIVVCADNTFATPYLQNPLDLGADIVLHSATKYLGGHSDVVMGALVTNREDLAEQFKFIQNACGAVPGPQDSFLMLRGIKTLHLRVERHCQNGEKIAHYLKSHPKVGHVYWPGFAEHPNHHIAKKQMRGFGGMISFTLKDDRVEEAIKVMESFELFSLAESLGGVESLVCHPASMTHASIPKDERLKAGLSDSLIRLSVGVEDAEDLIADLGAAIG